MMKLHFVYFALCSISHAAYVSRTVNRVRPPSVFRPGIAIQRPWTHQRIMPAASNRVPYVVYRNTPQRYAVKHFASNSLRYMHPGQWKTTTRGSPLPTSQEYDFIRAASSSPLFRTEGGTGAIHTIPAPNLSLAEKPIVVVDTSENNANANSATPEIPKPTYEVTEKLAENPVPVKIEQPIGFSKAASLSTPELQSLVRNGAALQLASEFGLSAIALPQSPIVPQQFTMQSYNGYPNPHDLMQSGAEGIIIPPNPIYQTDPSFLQKIQNQLLQTYPALEFIPYNPEGSPPPPMQIQSQPQPPLMLLQNEQIIKQTPSSFIPSNYGAQKNIVQRETQESSIVTLMPQVIVVGNATENQEVTSASEPQNVTLELVAAESQPQTTTVRYIIETNKEEPKTTPIYYAQIGENVGNAVVNGFYSAMNDVRAAAALAQVENEHETTKSETVNVEDATTTLNPETKTMFVQNIQKGENNHTASEIKSILGVPFSKPRESVNIAYTLMRADDKEVPNMTQNGVVFAGQIVEASVSADQDFDKERADILSRRAPVRLVAVTNKELNNEMDGSPPKFTIVKAKIPPKSKLTFDDKTGEPVLRIYASYADSPIQKEIITSKLANMKHTKDAVTRKADTFENWDVATVRSVDKTQSPLANQVTQFGVKLKARSDDYIPLFEDYDD